MKNKPLSDKDILSCFEIVNTELMTHEANLYGIMNVIFFLFTLPIIGKILKKEYKVGIQTWKEGYDRKSKDIENEQKKWQKAIMDEAYSKLLEVEWPEEKNDDDSFPH